MHIGPMPLARLARVRHHAAWLMVGATLLFAAMAACVKLASARYGTGEIVFYRGMVGFVVIAALTLWRGGSLRTSVPLMHLGRGVAGVAALVLWFYAMGRLPLATSVTLNYMSSVWMAAFLVLAAWAGRAPRVQPALVGAVLLGFAGVTLVLRPSFVASEHLAASAGLVSGMLAALAYLQVGALGRAGEPEYRVVFYFSLASAVVGVLLTLGHGFQSHTPGGLAALIGTGVLATAAQMMMTRAYAIGQPLANASLNYLGIAFSFGFGLVLFGERLSAPSLAGIGLIVVAGLWATRLRHATVAT